MSVAKEMIPPRPAPAVLHRPLTTAKVVGIGVLILWALLAMALISMVIEGWDPAKFERYGPRYLNGLWTTISLVGISIVLGAVLSLPIAFARMSKNRVLNAIAYAYVYIFRSTPLLAQLFLIYYGLGSFRPQLESVGLWWFFREAWYCGLFSLTLNTAAYQAEILRGAIQSVPVGQHEGAAALGISKRVAFWKIILPQALIVALRPYGNEIILMIKGSAVVAIVTVYDLMGETRYAFSRTFDYQTYLWAAIFYLTMVEALRHLWNFIERRLTRHLVR
ncbi:MULTISPECIES: ABC transporter permease [Rhizobiaceae]|jgi:polar amino acid transport system permease protein|uniref:Polar amino acid transport system permease protein n=1 Tax=Aliirhizobium cellulosilyticum TaxID=393664 RepID=A0A7W4SSQ0_9HYPH|nr:MULTISPECIES: ABC transporter permease [Rhizobium/Agrobacterium group]MBB4347737.1 polar amino acid transport system permease protein [Rhizobium cellulosilyticum]MBB4409869.1 polar amino acid transport system permease protein [Rhizobium cellulosilyticum]MBB4444556.1 polar amino acid transport system permease protein [Rhizobium cellulosilyticum]MBO0141716.1 ABC transporter permease [Agrobacterium sp. Ap1]